MGFLTIPTIDSDRLTGYVRHVELEKGHIDTPLSTPPTASSDESRFGHHFLHGSFRHAPGDAH